MPTKRDVLAHLTRDELLDVVDAFDLSPPDRRAKDGIMSTVAASPEKGDIYDVLAYVAFASPPVSREARAAHADEEVRASLTEQQRALVEFVLRHYVSQGVDQFDVDKLSPLLKLKYGSIEDATAKLGAPGTIRRVFIEFQRFLYEKLRAA